MILQKRFTSAIYGVPKILQSLTIVPVRGKKIKRDTRPFKVDPALYDPLLKEPISASKAFGDMAQERSREFTDDINSITARGFLRFQKAYEPPDNAVEKFLDLVRTISPNLSNESNQSLMSYSLDDPNFKYEVLTKAASEFQHSVPNSMLIVIRTLGPAAKFYDTPIETITPFDALKRMPDLPPNLYVQPDYIRFTDETKHFHGGISAFPRESTIITGLRAKQKYQGFKAQKVWTT